MDVQATFLKEKLTRDKVAFARIAPAGLDRRRCGELSGRSRPRTTSGAKGCRLTG